MATHTHTPDVIQPTTGDLDKHPRGLYVLFATEMWERFGFYAMLALFTLYLQDPQQGFGWSDASATSLYSWYLAFVYASPLLGGWLADKFIGYRRAVLIGGLIFMVGYFTLSVHSIAAVYAALVLLVIGNGFFKPNVSTMVGNLYPEGSHLKDRAYNIFYMGINIGAWLAPLVMEFTKRRIGYGPSFAIAGLGMIISIAVLYQFKREVEGHHTKSAQTPKAQADTAAVAVDAPPSALSRQTAMDAVPEWKRVGALIVIFLIVIVFWMAFHQNGSTLTYWADDNTDWNVSGTFSNSINPFWIITLTFPLVWFWRQLDKRGKEPSTPTKIALGMFLTALSFTILYFAARDGESQQVQSNMFASGTFRVTQRGLDALQAEGLPADVLNRLKAKGADDKSYVLNRKFTTSSTFESAWDSIKLDLQSQGIPEAEFNKLKDAKIEDGKFGEGKDFSAALESLAANLQGQGVANDVLERIRAYKSKSFTAEAKLTDELNRALGNQQAAQYREPILRHAYLFRVSPLWLIISYMVISLGELMLSPMGLSLVSKVAPIRMRGLLMGGWFVATAIGNKLTAIGVYWSIWKQSTFFIVLGGMAFIMAIVLLFLLRPLKKAMPGV